jgi:hypothetical protein
MRSGRRAIKAGSGDQGRIDGAISPARPAITGWTAAITAKPVG